MGNYNVDKNSMYTIYRLVCEGMNDNKYVCIFSYEDASTPGIIGFDCFWINVDGESEAKIRKFFIWRRRIYQIEQYRGKIIYVDADKDYSLTTLDFETDKKHVILKGFGKK